MFIQRIVAGLFALLLTTPCFAVSLAERSPFAQGQWWDPSRAGNGFEIVNVGDLVAVIWFTYNDAGQPTWYTAQGSLATLGTQAWPLMQYRWGSSSKPSPSAVGSLKLTTRHPESAEITWEIGSARGTWSIQPLIVSGVISEIDHSGVWFDPRNGGWGLSLTEQGETFGGVLYTYDFQGAPTWIAGFERSGLRNVEFHAYTGACPTCPYRPSVAASVGRLSFDLLSEAELALRSSLRVSMPAGVKVDGAQMAQLGRPASLRAADRQLATFHNASALQSYLLAGMLNVPYQTIPGTFSAAPPLPPANEFSSTNVQESGVDEADLVKTNGAYIYTFDANAVGARQPAVKIARVGSEGATLEIRGLVYLASGLTTPVSNAGLYLHGDKLVAVTGTQASSYIGSPWASPSSWINGRTLIEVMSIANPDAPATSWRAEITGSMVSSRRIGDRVYVVSRFVPFLAGFSYGTTYPPSVAANQQLLARTPLADLLPKVRINGSEAMPAVDFASIHAPPQGSRKPIADMVFITAIDLAGPRIAQTLAIVGMADTVYASTKNLFVATTRYEVRDLRGYALPVEPPFLMTDIHQIRLEKDQMAIVGSGSIEGNLGNEIDKAPFRLSEYQGQLRAVTSSMRWWSGTFNRLTILEPSTRTAGLLKTVSYIPNASRPQTLGKPNETLYSTRFLNERLYAVTFRRVDPLYVVDVADGADPKIAGALELPGFSDYLHPLPNGLLLGFGKEAQPTTGQGDGQFAWLQGLQLNLFDVRDANQPRELQRVVIGKRGSDSALLREHHAFSALMQADGSSSIAIPARIHDAPIPLFGNDAFTYPWQYSGLLRFALVGTSAVDARLVQSSALITHSVSKGSPYDDAATSGARSVLFKNGTIYVGKGRFWRQDSAGITYGPF